MGIDIVNHDPDIAVNFIQGYYPNVKNVLRLDGIYFNTSQDWKEQNRPIFESYKSADSVIVQSRFNKNLVTRYFGDRENIHVIHNGTDSKSIEKIEPAEIGVCKDNAWLCASSWRPHKRLADNIRYFQQHSSQEDILLVAGSGDLSAIEESKDDRVKYVGDLSWKQLISLMKASCKFIHLAFLDHCPNVVVDARASGCSVVCSSSGGTMEIAGKNATVVKDLSWDFSPIRLYDPPPLDFETIVENKQEAIIDIERVAEKYNVVFKEAQWA